MLKEKNHEALIYLILWVNFFHISIRIKESFQSWHYFTTEKYKILGYYYFMTKNVRDEIIILNIHDLI